MRVTLTRLAFIAGAIMAGACQDGSRDTTAPTYGAMFLRAAPEGSGLHVMGASR